MDIVKNFMEKDEQVIASTKVNLKMFALNKIKSYMLYIIMWVIMNGFFVYLFLMQQISNQYWFVCIPIIGFDLLGLLAIFNSIAKPSNEMADIGYVYTNKALYSYNIGRHKSVNRIAYADAKGFEKTGDGTRGFYVYAETNTIKVEYIDNEDFWYKEIAKYINQQ